MKDPSKKFEDLVVWRKAHQFVLGDIEFVKIPFSRHSGERRWFFKAIAAIQAFLFWMPDQVRYDDIRRFL